MAEASPPAGYPGELESQVLLADGRVAEVRPIVPGDAAALRAFDERLSQEAVYFRFFSPRGPLSAAQVERFVTVDYRDRLALVAFVGGELVAVGRYDRSPGGPEAEVAFVVRDDQQGRGIATVLLEHLASAASALGVRSFVADTLSANNKMLGVFRETGFEEHATFEAGVVRVVMSLDPVPAYIEHVEERDRSAVVASLRPLLMPASVAVVGASQRDETVGHKLLANLVAGGFPGPVYPVNESGGEIDGLRVYESVEDVPEGVDLAVIAVPSEDVASAVEQCGVKGVGGLVVISAGFAELGAGGYRAEGGVGGYRAEGGAGGHLAERRLVSLARRYGMRLIGPNCAGVINTSPTVSMNATLAPTSPLRGHIAFTSQSGDPSAVIDEATDRGLGISSFVSVGNKSDVSGNDLLLYWAADPETEVILLYVESFGNPRKFVSIARSVARKKPIVAVKSPPPSSIARGAQPHATATVTPVAAADALFHQAGVIRADTIEELFDIAGVLSQQPLPQGNGVAIVGNTSGPGELAADACEAHGLVVPELSAETQRRLRDVLASPAAMRNPVDCGASSTAADYGAALERVLEDTAISAVMVIFSSSPVIAATDVAAAVMSVAAKAAKPIVASFLASSSPSARFSEGDCHVPLLANPEAAARALARIYRYAAWRARPETPPPDYPDIDRPAGRLVVKRALMAASAQGVLGALAGGWLDQDAARELLAAYRIPQVTSAADVVQAMLPGLETTMGIVEDAVFGPLIMFGLRDTSTEALGDRALAHVPLSLPDAREMITSLFSSPNLARYRGAPAADLAALADVICRAGRLAVDIPEVVEMSLSLVVAGSRRCVALDAKVRVAAQASPEPALRRRHLG